MKTPHEFAKTPWAFFIHNWKVTLLILIGLALGGFLSIYTIPKESDPEVKVPVGVVSIAYPGASPTDIEKLVTDRMEERLAGLANVKELTSTSREGVSSIVVEYEASADLDESIRSLRDEVESAKVILPEDAEDPVVSEIRINDIPIITISLLGNAAPGDLELYAEELQSRLESIPYVSRVPLFGLERREMQVYVNRDAIQGRGITIGSVVQNIQSAHIDFPVGELNVDGLAYSASLRGSIDSADELRALPIGSLDDQPVLLGDIAIVREHFAYQTSASNVYESETGEKKRSVTLQVYKRTGGNILEVADESRRIAEAYERELPQGLTILTSNDFSEFIRDDIRTLGTTGLQTILIIFVIFLIALGFREALLTGLTIPFIFATAFLGLITIGETLNSLVLFSLILSLGLIVDTSIVIMEGIHDNIRNEGMNARDAALMSLQTYKAPLIASTLTTVSAFVPMALMTGIVGQFVKHIPITVTITLAASLIIALFFLPAMAVRSFRNFDPNKKRREPLLSHLIKPLRAKLKSFLHLVLQRGLYRWLVVIVMYTAFFVTVSFPFTGILKAELFPQVDIDFFQVSVEMPVGTAIEDTTRVTSLVEEKVANLPYVENYVTTFGGELVSFDIGAPSGGGANTASLTVNLVDPKERALKSFEVSDLLRAEVKDITEGKIEVQDLSAGPPQGAPIEARITGDDRASLLAAAAIVESELAQIDGTKDIGNNIESGTGEFQFKLKRESLTYYGVSAIQVATEIRTAVFGNSTVKIIRDGEETPVVVRMDFRAPACATDRDVQLREARDEVTLCPSRPTSADEILNLTIPTVRGRVPLSALADVSLENAVTSIQHQDQKQIMIVRATNREDVPVVDIVTELQSRLADMDLPRGVTVSFGGETEDVTESFQSLGYAMIVGILLIAFFLVLQFKSYRQPFIILMTLPMSLIGVFLGLALLGRNFSFPGFIGIVALAGVVVNDAIVLIDRMNKNLERGLERLDAIVTAAGERLQPIILTSVTTAAGVLPLAFTNELWGDLAWTIVFGILFSTILTLIVVPVLYVMVEKKEKSESVELT